MCGGISSTVRQGHQAVTLVLYVRLGPLFRVGRLRRYFHFEIAIETRMGARRCANGISSLFLSAEGCSAAPLGQLRPAFASKQPKLGNSSTVFSDTYVFPFPHFTQRARFLIHLSRRRRQRRHLPQYAAKQPPGQVTFGEQQPVLARVLYQASTGLHHPLWRLVSDQFTITLRSTSRRHRLPRL